MTGGSTARSFWALCFWAQAENKEANTKRMSMDECFMFTFFDECKGAKLLFLGVFQLANL
jgi:hypothetical protein